MGGTLLMAIALSLDGFGVGLAYGLRRIRISQASFVIIALCTILAMGTSMLLGTWAALYLKTIPAPVLGAAILFGIGAFQLIQAVRNKNRGIQGEVDSELLMPEAVPAMAVLNPEFSQSERAFEDEVREPVFRIQLRFLGLIIQVLRTPDMADMDKSGGISWKESFLLGSALAVDAFAAGIGAAMTGMSLILIGIVALTQMGMIKLGQFSAGKIPQEWLAHASYLPGVVLILVAVFKLL